MKALATHHVNCETQSCHDLKLVAVQHWACRLLGPEPGHINIPIPTSVSLGQTFDE